ncbi:MAG: PfkB family carbohydrate kinase, partial [Pseudomonadota bacterium]
GGLCGKSQHQEKQDKVGLKPEQLGERLEAFVINRRHKGCSIYTPNALYEIPTPRPKAVNDLGGSDDAFCAGLLYGLIEDIDWETTGRCATLLWAMNVEYHGTQSKQITADKFKALFQKVFGYALIT